MPATYLSPTADLSFAPSFRPFYPADLQGYELALDALAYPGELRAHGPDPRLDLTACKLVGGGLAIRLATTPLEVRHEAAHVSNTSQASVLVTVVMDGAGVIEQAGRIIEFGPGDIVFRTTALPSVVNVARSSRLLVLRLPVQRFFAAYEDLGRVFVPGHAGARDALAVAVHAHLDHVFPELQGMRPAAAYFAEHALVSLMAAAYCEHVSIPPQAAAAETDRWLRVVAFIDANLGDPDLSVEHIAKNLKVSKRWIHRLFQLRGEQYGAYLRNMRLRRARQELRDVRLRHLSVTDIALRNGFRDSSHFSRAFHACYGSPPSLYRRASC
jgi:AraC family transcriptional regulator, positive regulator of tynA and feaB